MNQKEEYRLWGRDPLSAEINEQIKAMPDRPSVILAIITFNKTPAEAKFRALGPFKDRFIRDLPYVMGEVKMVASLWGFEATEAPAFMGVVCSLADMNIDEAIIIEKGKAQLRLVQLIQATPPD